VRHRQSCLQQQSLNIIDSHPTPDGNGGSQEEEEEEKEEGEEAKYSVPRVGSKKAFTSLTTESGRHRPLVAFSTFIFETRARSRYSRQ